MRHLLTLKIGSILAIVVFITVDWKDIELSLLFQSVANKIDNMLPKQLTVAENEMEFEEDFTLLIDTIMYARGHAFGFRGDLSMWGGWYVDTICVGDDQMLLFDSIGPSSLKLSLITRELMVDLGDKDMVDKIRIFLNPINGFHRSIRNMSNVLIQLRMKNSA